MVYISDHHTSTTPLPKTVAPTKPTVTSVKVKFCSGRKSGNYADPTRCDGFIICDYGTAFYMDCPANLWYDPINDQCNYPEKVNCAGMYGLLYEINRL